LIDLLVSLFQFVTAFGMMRPNTAALALADQGQSVAPLLRTSARFRSCSARPSPRHRAQATLAAVRPPVWPPVCTCGSRDAIGP
jgi:hypothetical protein